MTACIHFVISTVIFLAWIWPVWESQKWIASWTNPSKTSQYHIIIYLTLHRQLLWSFYYAYKVFINTVSFISVYQKKPAPPHIMSLKKGEKLLGIPKIAENTFPSVSWLDVLIWKWPQVYSPVFISVFALATVLPSQI